MNEQSTSITAKVLFAVVLLLIAFTVWGVLVYNNPSSASPTITPQPKTPTLMPTNVPQPTEVTSLPSESPTPTSSELAPTAEPTPTPPVYDFIVRASEYKFEPKLIRVTPGAQVQIELKNTGSMAHSFVLEGLNVQTPLLAAGDSDVITFTAPSEPGQYTYFCSVEGHRALGMEGMLEIIEATQ